MRCRVIWYHSELRLALIERGDGFTIGSVEEGHLAPGLVVRGDFANPGLTTLQTEPVSHPVAFFIEANALSEEEADELLGFVRDASSDRG